MNAPFLVEILLYFRWPEKCLIKLLLLSSVRDKVVDFHWNTSDPWTVVSVSDDCDTTGGGGTLQVIMEF